MMKLKTQKNWGYEDEIKMNYIEEIKRAMTWLGKQKDTIFLGQTVCYPGSPMFPSFKNVNKSKKLELPVMEDCQMGMSIGLSLEGYIPISVFPRMDFLICAMNQLVNHLDKVTEMSNEEFQPGVIIRTQIGNTKPLYPGVQHCGNYYSMLKAGLKNVSVIKIKEAEDVIPNYRLAYSRAFIGLSTILIETPQGDVYKK